MIGLQIRTSAKEGKAPLYTRMRIEGKSVWVDLRLSVDIQQWNEASNSERKKSNLINRLGYTTKLAEIESGIRDLRLRNRLTRITLNELISNVSLAEIRERLLKDEELGKQIAIRKKNDVKNFIQKHVDGIIKGEILNTKGKKYSQNSVKSWIQFRRLFNLCYKNQSFTWDELSQSLIHQFLNFLDREGYMGETRNRHIGVFSSIITLAEKQKLHTNGIARKWLSAPCVQDNERKALIYLTKEELKALYDMPLTGMNERVRDMFLIACYTALRYCDFSKIEKGCIGYTEKGNKVIRIVQQKTKGLVVIPIINEELELLLKKYDYTVPDICEQVINRYIKDICKELSEKVPSLAMKMRTLLTKTERDGMKSGKMTFEFDSEGYPIKPRYELISCHTARRTAVTNMYLSGKFSTRQIMTISGHKKEETFLKYIRLSLDEKADDVVDAAYDGLF